MWTSKIIVIIFSLVTGLHWETHCSYSPAQPSIYLGREKGTERIVGEPWGRREAPGIRQQAFPPHCCHRVGRPTRGQVPFTNDG